MSDIDYEFCSILTNITTVPITLGSSFIVCQVFVSYVEIIKSKILLRQAPVHVSTFKISGLLIKQAHCEISSKMVKYVETFS